MKYKLALLLSVAIVPTAFAQSLPKERELSAKMAESLPPFYSVDDFDVLATVNDGDAINPNWRVRFEAEVSPKYDLYVPVGQNLGPFALMAESVASGESKRLYGTMRLTFRSGEWSTEVNLENPLDRSGLPLASMTMPSLVLGSDREREMQATLSEAAVKAAKESLDRALNAAKGEHEARLAKLREEHSQEVKALADANTKEIAQLSAKQASAIEKERLASEQAEQRLKATIAALEQEITANETVIAKQKAVLDTATTVEKNRALINDLFKSKSSGAEDFAKTLAGRWVGNLRCPNGYTVSIDFNAAQVQGRQVVGEFAFQGSSRGKRMASLTPASADNTPPVALTLVTEGSDAFDYNLTMAADGTLTGNPTHSNYKECVLFLGK